LEEKESATIIEVGQTLFQPVTHPGFLEGKTMVKGVLVAQCRYVQSMLKVLDSARAM
jgi:hypothetical protein